MTINDRLLYLSRPCINDIPILKNVSLSLPVIVRAGYILNPCNEVFTLSIVSMLIATFDSCYYGGKLS
jgi:hypothetical protein